MNINGKTRIAAVIGDPIEHTLSPMIHNTLAAQTGINAAYTAFHVKPDNLGGAAEALRAFNMAGMNVTVPHKERIIPYLDDCDELAKGIGAVNTVVQRGGQLTGYNTDASGFLRMLKKAGIEPEGKKVGLIGAGGAARAVSFALKSAGASKVFICDQLQDKAQALAADVGAEAVTSFPDDIEIIVNATPVGMHPHVNNCPIDSMDRFAGLTAAVDLIYRPAKTLFLQMADSRGVKTVGGLSMLVYQAVEAFERFFEVEVNETMVQAVFDRMKLSKNIVLTGFMATGKSAIGKTIANKIGAEFVDMDEAIERAAGMPISEIFKTKGQDWFRDLESEMIRRYKDAEHTVISLGGGAVLRKENIEAMRENGVVVCLRADIRTIAARLGSGTRPLGDGKSIEELTALLNQRKPYYDNCDADIDCSKLNPQQAAEQILSKVYSICEI